MNNQEEGYIWYFAIGSMMNPTSLSMRELKPVESYPGQIINYALKFFGNMGMAEAVSEEGASFHGVLHKMTSRDMTVLDGVEVTYERKTCSVKLYDGRVVDATVYCRNNNKLESSNVVAEHYMEILISGCEHYGVAQSHIEYLRSIPIIPRKKPEEFRKLRVPEALPVWENSLIATGDGKEGRPVYMGVNGKVCQYNGTEAYFIHKLLVDRVAGGHMEIFFSRGLYEPRYGVHERLEEYTREHCAFIEDLAVEHETQNVMHVVALFEQVYGDGGTSFTR